MYVFVLVGLWTHQFMTYDVMLLDQCLIDLLPLPAIHPHLFARDYRKKQPPVASPPHVRSMQRPLFAHSPIFLLTPGSSYDHPLFAYFSCVNLLRICIRMGRARCSYLSVQIQKKKGIYVLGTCWSMLTTCQMQALRSRL